MILIDPPAWPAHGRLWSHLASDTSLDELHSFAEHQGLPPRAFESDHYDVAAERYDTLVAAGAVPASTRDLLAAIVAAGLRRPRRRSEEVVRSREVVDYFPGAGRCRVDVISSGLQIPAQARVSGWWIDIRDSLIRVEQHEDGWRLPRLASGDPGGEPLGYVRIRLLGQPGPAYQGPVPWVFRPARRPDAGQAVAEDTGEGRRLPPSDWIPIEGLAEPLGRIDVWALIDRLAET